jgi:gamma-glutamylcyclotransferase (GGCT)/AIG2-like uncharacterized protein YtfP
VSDELLFVYGTLMRASGHPMHAELARAGTFVGRAAIRGELVDLGAYPGLVLERAGEACGELWALHDANALAMLDAYEGIVDDDEAPDRYERVRAEVRLDDGSVYQAWVYAWRSVNADARRS